MRRDDQIEPEIDIEEVRSSINIIRNSTSTTPVGNEEQNQANNEKRWRLSFMKQQFESLQLHTLFHRYTERINHGYFSQFLSLQFLLSATHFVLILGTNWFSLQDVIPDLVMYGFVVLFSIILLVLTDTFVKAHPKLLNYFAISSFLIVFFVNGFIPFYFREDVMYVRPAYTTHLIIASYVFFNIDSNLISAVLGFFVSIFHIVVLLLVTYRDEERSYMWRRLLSDAIFLSFLNVLGLYFRYMNEIVKRRSFLDRRFCVESTLQVEFEKNQESDLMSSIIPNHILERFKSEIVKFWEEYCEDSDRMYNISAEETPFEHPYVEEHENVTILFADIVNYTQMTTKYRNKITELLDTLNELFTRFDEASVKLKVLRIKFLGDCYYCVSGLPPDPAPNHAEACVDLGLKMIEIIANVRRERKLNIDMRIGIHTGTITSGVIGSIKWQYDIWSNDADTANKMESEGVQGKVHITESTRNLLTKDYEIGPQYKIVNNFKTYLICPTGPIYVNLNNNNDHNIPDGNNKRELQRSISESQSEPNLRKTQLYKKNEGRNSASGSILSNHMSSSQRTSLSSELLIDNPIQEEPPNGDDLMANARRDTLSLKRHPLMAINNGVRGRLSGSLGASTVQKKVSVNARMSGERRLTAWDGKRRTAFMNNNVKRYEERLKETNETLNKTIDNMLLSKFEQWFKVTDMNRCTLFFKNWNSELHFLTMPDPLFKYYIVNSLILMLLVFVMQNLTLPSGYWQWNSWEFYIGFVIIIFLFLPLTWTHYLWVRHVSKHKIDAPRNIIVRFFYEKSKFVTNNVLARIVIYTITCVILFTCVLVELIECHDSENQSSTSNKIKSTSTNFFTLLLRSNNNNSTVDCIIPWHMTETCALAIIMTFLFIRMYMWIKFLYATIITIVYSYCVWNWSEKLIIGSETFNHHLHPKIAQILSVVFVTIILHLVDRQTEYMNRLDHLWYEALVLEQNKARSVHVINSLLLKNILPKHVAELYLDTNRRLSDDLYHEYYDNAAVLFASIINYSTEDMGTEFLTVMNAIICAFDMLSVKNSFGRPIEKIKVAKWTYMAACGLVPGLGNAENIRLDQVNHSVISLCKFAAALMESLANKNKECFQNIQLRIGIAYGPIAAGVVGSKKPLYDIWGDPVNMASRMDTCGLPNRIQVLENTAEIIQEYGYVCNYRDTIRVKGLAEKARTYFVALDDNYELLRQDTIT